MKTSPESNGSTAGQSLRDAISVLRESGVIAGEPRAARALEIIARTLQRADGQAPAPTRTVEFATSPLDLEEVLRSALSLTVDIMEADRGFIVPLGADRIVSVFHLDREAHECSDEPPRALIAQTLQHGEVTFTNDAEHDPRLSAEQRGARGRLHSFACVPLFVRGDIIGALYLDSSDAAKPFKSSDRAMLLAFAQQAALAIDYARMFEEQRDRADRVATLQAFQTRILEAIASGVVTLDSNRIITTFNRSAEATFGVRAEDVVGKSSETIGAYIPDFAELLGLFYESGTVNLRAEVEAHDSAANERTLDIQLAPLGTAQGAGAAIVVTDVTKYRRLELAHEAQIVKAGRIAETFSRYLAPHVVDRLMNDPGSVKLGGERQRGTMLFADISGFTALAAHLPAERVVEILNLYFEEAVRIVFEHDGLLDKFYGDGLMAVFGPPLAREDDASRAVAAAIRLHEAVERLAPTLEYPLRISVGLATGEVVAGDIGSSKRMDYTVIGDAVNLASGLQSAAPPGTIYCDEETIARAGRIGLPMTRHSVSIKGRSASVRAYAIEPTRTVASA